MNVLWQSCQLWSSTWLPINPKCTLEGVQVVIKDPLKKQKTYDFPSKTWQITACVHVYDLSWKNRSQNQLVGWVGSPAVAAVKMNQCITIQIKGTQEMKSHLYMQQNAGVDCCFNRLKSSYFVIGAHSLCVCFWVNHTDEQSYPNALWVLSTWTWVMTRGVGYDGNTSAHFLWGVRSFYCPGAWWSGTGLLLYLMQRLK